MHKNLIWLSFLAFVFLMMLWFTAIALYAFYSYHQLKVQTTVSSIDWDIQQRSEDAYFFIAHYQFLFQGHTYSGTTSFPNDIYLNRWTAEQDLKAGRGKQWKVWFDPSYPNHSSLEHHFPVKQIFSAVCLCGLFLYFLWLGFYVSRFKT
jgi:hypothetical protein